MIALRTSLAIVLALAAGVSLAQSRGGERGSSPPAISQDGSRPSEGAIERSATGPGQAGGIPGVNLCRELKGAVREQCRIEAQSKGEGQGTEFIVRLPLTDRPLDAVQAAAAHPVPGRATGRKVLVVDDNSDMTDSLATLLRLQGYEVQTAGDGEEALRAANAFRPDVVLLDIGLPEKDGYEVARAITPGAVGQTYAVDRAKRPGTRAGPAALRRGGIRLLSHETR